uniref:Uncharacterized protein n=1 Tax=Ditylenchus dipsaci TaxID=166011 RepID=A0A915EQM4_9BILA
MCGPALVMPRWANFIVTPVEPLAISIAVCWNARVLIYLHGCSIRAKANIIGQKALIDLKQGMIGLFLQFIYNLASIRWEIEKKTTFSAAFLKSSSLVFLVCHLTGIFLRTSELSPNSKCIHTHYADYAQVGYQTVPNRRQSDEIGGRQETNHCI